MKTKKKYITITDGTDFRTIAKKMTIQYGHKMNHATARNLLLSALENFLKNLGNELGVKIDEEKLDILMKNQDFHNNLSECLYLIGKEHEKSLQ